MITEFLFDMIEGVVHGLLSLIPHWTPPSWLTDGTFGNGVQAVAVKAAPMGAWVPWTVMVAACASVLAVWAGTVVLSVSLKLYAMIRGGAS
ncbi:MAG: hypothetical protein JWM89_1531 [Acidimicrobiales bacterium]|nr:hypothetical protein [Acidimicrobiales bacterium]